MQLPAETVNALSDLTRLATASMFAVVLYFIRGVLQSFEKLKEDVHGSGGINERLARVEERIS